MDLGPLRDVYGNALPTPIPEPGQVHHDPRLQRGNAAVPRAAVSDLRQACVNPPPFLKRGVLFQEVREGGRRVRSWDCRIEVIRETVVEAEDEAQATGMALDWFFSACLHAIDERDVFVEAIEDQRTDG